MASRDKFTKTTYGYKTYSYPLCDMIDFFEIQYHRFENNNWIYKIIHISSSLDLSLQPQLIFDSEPYGDLKICIFESGLLVLDKALELSKDRNAKSKKEYKKFLKEVGEG